MLIINFTNLVYLCILLFIQISKSVPHRNKQKQFREEYDYKKIHKTIFWYSKNYRYQEDFTIEKQLAESLSTLSWLAEILELRKG